MEIETPFLIRSKFKTDEAYSVVFNNLIYGADELDAAQRFRTTYPAHEIVAPLEPAPWA